MKVFKFTDEYDRTRGRTGLSWIQWGPGVTHRSSETGTCDPCTPRAIHAYQDPVLAVMMDPVHGRYLPGGHMWTAEMKVAGTDGTKVWGRQLTTLGRVDVPVVTREQRIRFGILAAMEVTLDRAWRRWAERWLSGSGRSLEAASAAESAAESAARASVGASVRAASAAPEWAAAKWAAALAARASALSASWEAEAATRAVKANPNLDLAAFARRAVAEEEQP